MNKTIYLICQLLLILLVFLLITGVLYVLQKAMVHTDIMVSKQKKLLIYTTGGFVFWLSFLSILGYWMLFQQIEIFFLFILFSLPFVILIYLFISKSFGKIVENIPMKWMTYGQSFRIILELIFWLGLTGGFVPFQMTFEGFNFDILVGFTALMGGFVFFGHNRYRRFEAIIWNISGITLLINLVFIAALSFPSSLRVFMNEPSNLFLVHFPFIWIPGFTLPFAFALHLFSIKILMIRKGPKIRKFSLNRNTS